MDLFHLDDMVYKPESVNLKKMSRNHIYKLDDRHLVNLQDLHGPDDRHSIDLFHFDDMVNRTEFVNLKKIRRNSTSLMISTLWTCRIFTDMMIGTPWTCFMFMIWFVDLSL